MAQGTRPKNRKEFLSKLNEPYSANNPNPNQIFTEPKKAGMPEVNRALEISLEDPVDKDFYVGIKDIDEAVMYYFQKVLKLSVLQNNTLVEVPIIYGTPENWKSFQKDGYYRDKEGRLLAPLLMYKRNTVTQNRTLGNKLDGNFSYNIQSFQKKYSKRNFYSNFNVLTNRSPETEYKLSATPDYVTVEYSCVVWTYFMEQMSKLIEEINFASRSYWGDPNRYQFYSSIESFSDSTQYEQGEDRAVRTNFTLTLNGYLIPDSYNKKVAAASKVFGLSRLVFGLEATDSPLETFTAAKKSSGKKSLGSIIAADSTNVVVQNITTTTLAQDITVYINTNITKTANSITVPDTATFTGASILQPPAGSGLPNTTVQNFTFFINGQYIPSSMVTLSAYSGYVNAVFDTNQVGYTLETDDEIIAIGKWQS